MNSSRRKALLTTLFGGSYLGLRALATGLPLGFLLNPRRAMAAVPDGGAGTSIKPQYIIMTTSTAGDPINCNAPGTYGAAGSALANVYHPQVAGFQTGTSLTLGSTATTAAAPWATLPQSVLDRMAFWHIMTNTPVHPDEPNVLKLMGASQYSEMLPSLLAKQLKAPLGTIQAQPISVGAASPSEGLSFGGAALPIIPPVALKDTLVNPTSGSPLAGLTTLHTLRDSTVQSLYGLYKNGSKPQQAYIDSLLLSQSNAREVSQSLLDTLSSITDNSVASQITAAVALIRMQVTPVISIHIPFGGDNHTDGGLAGEVAQTTSGVASIAALMASLDGTATASGGKLSDNVTVMSLNVFGRTIGTGAGDNSNGRNHNEIHQVSFTIGNTLRAGIIGGIAETTSGSSKGEYGATAIDPASGNAITSGGIAPIATLASFGQTMLAAVGVDDATIGTLITQGQIVKGAVKTA